MKAPHPKRKERWEKLNDILEQNKKKSKISDRYSYVTWKQVKNILCTTPYVQSTKDIPEVKFDFLSQYLSFATKCFGSLFFGKESHRLHLIAPIIICVCSLLNDVTILVDEDLDGNYLKAHGHFEFVLRRGDKTVCIVEEKRDDINHGMVQDAEIGHLSKVYGIVTNYLQWNFLRSLDEKIEVDECSIRILPGGRPTSDSLVEITGKIYALLSDE